MWLIQFTAWKRKRDANANWGISLLLKEPPTLGNLLNMRSSFIEGNHNIWEGRDGLIGLAKWEEDAKWSQLRQDTRDGSFSPSAFI